jgi:leucyl-tRNA synthetase
MSKSRGNVVAPDKEVERWGADCFRAHLMFMGPWDQGGPFNTAGLAGIWRWMNRVWAVVLDEPEYGETDAASTKELRHQTHRIIRRVSEDMAEFSFNTMLARLMEYTSFLGKLRDSGQPVDREAWIEARDNLMLVLAPILPHMSEELWARTGHPYSIHQQTWPSFDAELAKDEKVTLVVQVNGKLRERIDVPAGIGEDEARRLALESPRVADSLNGAEVARVIYVPGRLVNVVTK